MNWELKDKVATVIKNNAKNMVNTVQLHSSTTDVNISDITCETYSLQLSRNKALKKDSIFKILKQRSRLVNHFTKHHLRHFFQIWRNNHY